MLNPIELFVIVFVLMTTVPMLILAYLSNRDDLKIDKIEESYRDRIRTLCHQKKNLEYEALKLEKYLSVSKDDKPTLYFPPDIISEKDIE